MSHYIWRDAKQLRTVPTKMLLLSMQQDFHGDPLLTLAKSVINQTVIKIKHKHLPDRPSAL